MAFPRYAGTTILTTQAQNLNFENIDNEEKGLRALFLFLRGASRFQPYAGPRGRTIAPEYYALPPSKDQKIDSEGEHHWEETFPLQIPEKASKLPMQYLCDGGRGEQ